jgi:iron complex transport system ATP-binding protein
MNRASRLEAVDLCVSVAGKAVCRDLSLSVTPGERWGILGVNGVGKTTLLHVLAGLRPPQGGEVRLDGVPLAAWERRLAACQLGVLFQDAEDTFPGTALEETLIGRHPHLAPWSWETPADERLARSALERVGLTGMESRIASTLSGGERRRLALAALLAQDPRFFLLDEPTNHLDMHYQVGMLALLSGLAEQGGKALVMVLHDVNLAARFCTHLLLLFGDGEAICGDAGELLREDSLTRLYRHPVRCIGGPDGRYFHPR